MKLSQVKRIVDGLTGSSRADTVGQVDWDPDVTVGEQTVTIRTCSDEKHIWPNPPGTPLDGAPFTAVPDVAAMPEKPVMRPEFEDELLHSWVLQLVATPRSGQTSSFWALTAIHDICKRHGGSISATEMIDAVARALKRKVPQYDPWEP